MAAYNAEETIERALDSIRMQSVSTEDYEVIVVNDGSKDRTSELLHRYQDEYSALQLTILDIPNSGVCAARNQALSVANGIYVTFLDSDDYYGSNIVNSFLKVVKEHPKVDLWKYGCIEHYLEDNKPIQDKQNDVEVFHVVGKDAVIHKALELETIPLFGYVWNSFFKRDLIDIHGIRFSSEYIMEDFMFNFDYVKHAMQMASIPNVYYHYMIYVNKESLSKKVEPQYYEQYRNKIAIIYEYAKEIGTTNDDTYRIVANLYVRYLLSSLERLSTLQERKQLLNQIWQDSLFTAIKRYMGSTTSVIGILSYLFKYQYTSAILGVNALIHYIRHNCKGLFAIMKSK